MATPTATDPVSPVAESVECPAPASGETEVAAAQPSAALHAEDIEADASPLFTQLGTKLTSNV